MSTRVPAVPAGAAGEETQAAQVRAHFRDTATYWHDLYHREDPVAAVFRRRQAVALEMVESLSLPPGSRVLEVGTGAGFLTVELVRRKLVVTAIDAAIEMLGVAQANLDRNGLSDAVELLPGDVHALGFADSSYDLVVALGVIPWLHSPGRALSEIARVLAPRRHAIVTSDNRARLNHLLDPVFSPLIARPRGAISSAWRRARRTAPDARFHPHMFWPRQFRRMVENAGLEPLQDRTVGFGQFSIFAHPLLGGTLGVAVHERLQALADSGFPLVRETGCHQVMLARKAETRTP